jgi:hypothetical protein
LHITFTVKVKPSLEKNTTVEDAHIIPTNIQNQITKETGASRDRSFQSHDTYGTSLTMMAEESRLVNYYEEKIFHLKYVGKPQYISLFEELN